MLNVTLIKVLVLLKTIKYGQQLKLGSLRIIRSSYSEYDFNDVLVTSW